MAVRWQGPPLACRQGMPAGLGTERMLPRPRHRVAVGPRAQPGGPRHAPRSLLGAGVLEARRALPFWRCRIKLTSTPGWEGECGYSPPRGSLALPQARQEGDVTREKGPRGPRSGIGR